MAWHPWIRSKTYPEIWTAVYRLYGAAGRLLYVGIGYDYLARWKSHAKRGWWPQVVRKDVTWYDSRLVAAYDEAQAIRDEHPVHNERPGICPAGFIVFERNDRYGHRVCPAYPDMAVGEYEQIEAMREVRWHRAHMAIAYEGGMVAVLVPPNWYAEACAALGGPVPARMEVEASREDVARAVTIAVAKAMKDLTDL